MTRNTREDNEFVGQYPEFKIDVLAWDDLPSFLDTVEKPQVDWQEFKRNNECKCGHVATVRSEWEESVPGALSAMGGLGLRLLIAEKTKANGQPRFHLFCEECHREVSSQMPFAVVEKFRKYVERYESLPAPTFSRSRTFEQFATVRKSEWSVYESYLSSYLWQVRCRRVKARDLNRCQCCMDRGEVVHHRTYDRVFKEDMNDLVLLCRRCHDVIHAHLAVKQIPQKSTESIRVAIMGHSRTGS